MLGTMILSLALATSVYARETAAVRLRHADSIKTAQYPAFDAALRELESERTALPVGQRDHLDYLQGWKHAYLADYAAAVTQLKQVARNTRDPTLRFRAEATIVNALTIARRYEEALTHLNVMLTLLPSVRDAEVRGQGLLSAVQIHTQVGQYDVAMAYAERLLREATTSRVQCIAMQLKIEARLKMGRLDRNDGEARQAVAKCVSAGETIFANLIRTVIAKVDIREAATDDAIALLMGNYEEVQATGYTRLISDYDSQLAQAWWEKRDLGKARAYAQRAIDQSAGKDLTEPLVEAYRLLFLVAREQGNSREALAFHETYAAADKRFLDDIGARELVFQMVKSQAMASRLQIEALNKRNQVLNLQQELGKKAVETGRLYILLLIVGLAFIAMWLWKTKRSQLHFMQLARRDGLTGIFNREHFSDAAEGVLTYCRKVEREACAVLMDLDHFKRVNDLHGHAVGDVVLRRTVQACQAHLRAIDIIGRLGGEEFGIVLPDCSPERALELAEQFRLSVASLSNPETGLGFPVSASFGVSSTRSSGYNLRQLIIHADSAMYRAKELGRSRVELFDAEAPGPANAGVAPTYDRWRAQ